MDPSSTGFYRVVQNVEYEWRVCVSFTDALVKMSVFNCSRARFSDGCCHASESAGTYVHATVHCVNLFSIFLSVACYLMFANNMEWNGLITELLK